MLSLLFLLACGKPPAKPTDTAPSFYGAVPRNVLMISLDTFRRDHLTRYGDTRQLMPFLDELMEEGVVLDDHRSCSNWTYPGTSCVANGSYNLDQGFVTRFDRTPWPDRPTLASALTDAGYKTILVSSNGWLTDETNVDYGFSYSEHPSNTSATNVYLIGRDELLRAKDAGLADRWFLHIHLKEPHAAYSPPDEYLTALQDLPPLDIDLDDFDDHYAGTQEWGALTPEEQELLLQHLIVRYTAELRYLDDQLRRIWSDLRLNGLLEDTLVVFWNDHGEQFWEHGYQAHAEALHSEENDGVAFFWADSIVPAAWPEPTTHADLAPTLLTLLDVDVPSSMTGYPLAEAPEGRPIFSDSVARLGVVQSVVLDGYKLHYQWSNGEKMLFDTTVDREERIDLYDPADPLAADLWAELLPQVEDLQPLVEYTPVDPGI